MKNTRKMSERLWAFLLAAMLLITSCMTVFATEESTGTGTTPSADDKGTITVTNVTGNPTLTAYKIVEGKYDDNGFVGYELVNAVKGDIGKVTDPTAAEIFAIAKKISDNQVTLESVTLKKSGENYVAEGLGVGEYIVIATNTDTVVYNPMIVSVYYDVNGVHAGTVSAIDHWTVEGSTTVAKSAEPRIDKTIPAASSTGKNGYDAAIGDKIEYQVEADIPSYSDQYDTDTLKYTITDTMSTGLELQKDAKVFVDGQEVAEAENTFTVRYEGQTMTIDFKPAYIKENGGKRVKVTYSGILLNAAKVNMDANDNTAKVEYTNKPGQVAGGEKNTTEKESKTYTYTFELDGKISASATVEGNGKKTHEIIKVDKNGNQTKIDETTEVDENGEHTIEHALEGATFKLTNNATGKEYTATTDKNGYFNGFKGLDAGEYTLQETAAPTGYSLDPTQHTVKIEAFYNGNGTLDHYTVKIDGTATSTYKATYGEDKELTEVKAEGEVTTTFIKNTKLGSLPATGGIGTYIFTVIGVALMVIAAVMYLRKRKAA